MHVFELWEEAIKPGADIEGIQIQMYRKALGHESKQNKADWKWSRQANKTNNEDYVPPQCKMQYGPSALDVDRMDGGVQTRCVSSHQLGGL